MAGIGLVAGANKFQFKEKYDALKEAEQKQKLSQPNKKLTTNENQKKDLSDLTTLLGSFKGDIDSIINGDAFGKSKVETTGESASISTSAGVNISDFDINVRELASKDAYQTKGFSSEVFGIFADVSVINSKGEREMLKNAEFKLQVGKEEFTIMINSGDSLQSLNDKILGAVNKDGKKLKDLVNTKVLETGKDNYRLMITSKEPGIDNEIKFKISENKDNPDTEIYSKAVLRKLGLLDSVKESEVRDSMRNSEKMYKSAEGLLSDAKIDVSTIQDFVKNLGADTELKYKDEDGNEHTFTINKDTDLEKLSKEQNGAVFSFYKEEQLKSWVEERLKDGPLEIKYSNNGVENTFKIENISDLAGLSEDKKMGLKIAVSEDNLKTWVDFIKNSGDEINIKNLSINSETDFSKLTLEDKKLIYEYVDNLQEEYFVNFNNFSKTTKELEGLEKSNENHVQRAKDAIFEYDGIEITKSSNVIDDLILGAKITLKKEGITNFKVEDDIESLLEHLDTFTSNYNSIVNSLAISTKFDDKTKEAGSLQGITEISQLKYQLSSLITKTDSNWISLSSLGFELNEKGILTFKKSEFKKAFENNPNDVKNFLQGSVKYEELKLDGGKVEEQIGLAEGDFKINGVDIVFDKSFIDKLQDEKEVVKKGEYLNKLIEAINNAKISGVTAMLGKDDNIIIVSDGKNPLEISGDSSKLKKLGLEEKTLPSIKKEQTGIFREFKDTLDSLSGRNGSLTRLNEKLDKEKDDLTKEIKSINEEIERKFDTLASKLNSYDIMLSKLDRQSETINALINAAFANK